VQLRSKLSELRLRLSRSDDGDERRIVSTERQSVDVRLIEVVGLGLGLRDVFTQFLQIYSADYIKPG